MKYYNYWYGYIRNTFSTSISNKTPRLLSRMQDLAYQRRNIKPNNK